MSCYPIDLCIQPSYPVYIIYMTPLLYLSLQAGTPLPVSVKATADTGDISQLQAMQQQSTETFAEGLCAREQRHTTERCLAVARRLVMHVERVRYVLNEELLQLIAAQNKSAWAYTMVDCV